MLSDDDPRHRVSALWVARRSRAKPVVGDLRRLADSDRFSEIRDRATAVARILDHQVLAPSGGGGMTS
jgi:hypothetical protein